MQDSSIVDSPDETILAVSTPPGTSRLAMIRLSGPQAISSLERLATRGAGSLASAPGSTGLGMVLRAGTADVPVWVQVYRAPRSYTREDMVELHMPGALPLVRLVSRALTASGSRLRWARAGEFTLRALLNGRIDLTRAEAVAGLISATGEAEALAARRALRGELGEAIHALCRSLLELLALLEAGLDFPDEELPELAEESIRGQIDRLIEEEARLRGSVALRVPVEGCLRVVLAGFPNAGKSSLLNAVLGRGAAITSELPGTTRDPVRGLSEHGGRRVEWIDVAGTRSVDWPALESPLGEEDASPAGLPGVPEGEERDREEALRIAALVRRLTRLELETADRVLWVVDASTVGTAAFRDSLEQFDRLQALSRTLVFQKVDLIDGKTAALLAGRYGGALSVSARTGTGMERLVEQVLQGGPRATAGPGVPRLLVSAHQEAALETASEALHRARRALGQGLGNECVVADLRDALRALEEVSGAVPREAVLEWIFSQFCIGK